MEVQAGEDSPVLALQLRQLMKSLSPQDQRKIEQVDQVAILAYCLLLVDCSALQSYTLLLAQNFT